MAKDRSDKSRYHSRYRGGYVSASQYIAELICEKKASCDKKELPVKFWFVGEWKKFYSFQVVLASRLLKTFEPKAIIMALMRKESYKTYSLGSPFIKKLIQEEQTKLDNAEEVEATKFEDIDINAVPQHNVKTKLDKLLELDNE